MPGLSKEQQHKTNSPVLSAYKIHVDALRRFISRFVGKHDVEDVVQEAFLRAYNAESGKPIEQPKSYLVRIAKHVALNQLRQRSGERGRPSGERGRTYVSY